jgi:hypothetical protein
VTCTVVYYKELRIVGDNGRKTKRRSSRKGISLNEPYCEETTVSFRVLEIIWEEIQNFTDLR